ncbi:FtsX-like permease family protein [Parabacteroides sp. OttesenSCG-928-J18]|nr:FtsX-like permease family protein [Parabacteroides sp. OttesenSCG-928-J18]
MIRHICKIIWNERKANGWILVEFIVVFCILWFCCDYLSFIVRSNNDPLGFDIDHTYQIRMSRKIQYKAPEGEETDNYALMQTFVSRAKQYPGIENIAFSNAAAPYLGSLSRSSMLSLPDSIWVGARTRQVSSEFFEVFKIKPERGRIFNWEDKAESRNVIVSGNRNGCFDYFDEKGKTVELSKMKSFYYENEKTEYPIVGVVNPTKEDPYSYYEPCIYFPLDHNEVNLESEIVIRVSPHADKDFAARFTKEMRDQLNLGPYFLSSVTSLQERKKEVLKNNGITGNLNSIYAITSFLVINIFLGLIGTFWYRVQSRRSEIGTRISMGASKKNVKRMLFGETLILLFIASFVAVNICLNIAQTDFLEAIGLPESQRDYIGAGIEQDFINYFVTYLFLAVVSLFAVWYPARQAVSVPPAEALREE